MPPIFHPPTFLHFTTHFCLSTCLHYHPPTTTANHTHAATYLPHTYFLHLTNHCLSTSCLHYRPPTTTINLISHTHTATHLPPTYISLLYNPLLLIPFLLASLRPPTTTTNLIRPTHTVTHLPLQSTCHHPPTRLATTTHHSKYSYQLIVEHRRWGRSGVGKAPVYLSGG